MACVKRSSNKWLRDFIMSFHEDFLTTSCSFRLIKRIPGLGWPSVLCSSAAAPFFFTNNNIASARGLVIGHPCGGGGARVALAILHSPVLHDPGIDSVWHLTWPRATTLSTSGWGASGRGPSGWGFFCWGASGWRVFGGGASGWNYKVTD